MQKKLQALHCIFVVFVLFLRFCTFLHIPPKYGFLCIFVHLFFEPGLAHLHLKTAPNLVRWDHLRYTVREGPPSQPSSLPKFLQRGRAGPTLNAGGRAFLSDRQPLTLASPPVLTTPRSSDQPPE